MFRSDTQRGRLMIAVSVGTLIALLGFVIISGMSRSDRLRDRSDLEQRTATAADAIEQWFDLTVSDLRAIGAFYSSTPSLTDAQIAEFTSRLNIARNSISVAIVKRVTDAELADVTRDLQARHGVKPYRIVNGIQVPIDDPGTRYIVTNQYGLPPGATIVGFDYTSEPSRAELMSELQRRRAPVFGEIVTLVGLDTEGFPAAVPIVGENAMILGATIAAIELAPMIEAAIPLEVAADVDITLIEAGSDPVRSEGNRATATLERGGKLWTVIGTARTPFDATPYYLAMIPVGLLALAVALLLVYNLAGRDSRRRLHRVQAEHQAEIEQRRVLERFEVLASTATDMVTQTSLRGRYGYVSPSSDRLLGFTPEDLLGRSIFELLHPDDRDRIIEAYRPLIEGDVERVECEFRIRNSSGEYRWFDSSSQCIVGQDGVEIRTSSRDVTEKMEQGALLEHARQDAEAAGAAKAQFVANISHEIRTPLNAILGMTDLALASDLSGSQREQLEIVKSSAKGLITIVNDVLDLSKAASGKMTLNEEGFAPRDVFSDVVRSLEPQANSKGLHLILEYDDRLPNGLIGDPGRIRQVLVNLVGNALKFTHVGGVTLTVTRTESETISCRVSDTGIGIPTDRIAAIFDDFIQVDGSTTRNYGGTGLGLGIARRLVVLMGGEMIVDSVPGVGSTFSFELPLTEWEPFAGDSGEGAVPVVATRIEDADAMDTLLAIGDLRVQHLTLDDLDATHLDVIAVVYGTEDPIARAACQDGRRVMIVDNEPARGNAGRFRDMGAMAYIGRPAQAMDLIDLFKEMQTRGRGFLTRHELRDNRRSVKVLVADDVGTNRMIVEQLLGRRGHTVIGVENGLEALEMAEAERPDVILMDVQMPVMDGLEATRRIRATEWDQAQRVPIIALTGRAMEGDRETALAAGCDGYMTKPFDPYQLLMTVEQLTPTDRIEPAPERHPVEAAIDRTVLTAMTGGDQEMIDTLLETARTEIVEHRLALLADRPEDLVSPAHTLKGLLGMIGALRGSVAAAALEDSARTGELDTVCPLRDDLDEILGAVLAEIEGTVTQPLSQ